MPQRKVLHTKPFHIRATSGIPRPSRLLCPIDPVPICELEQQHGVSHHESDLRHSALDDSFSVDTSL